MRAVAETSEVSQAMSPTERSVALIVVLWCVGNCPEANPNFWPACRDSQIGSTNRSNKWVPVARCRRCGHAMVGTFLSSPARVIINPCGTKVQSCSGLASSMRQTGRNDGELTLASCLKARLAAPPRVVASPLVVTVTLTPLSYDTLQCLRTVG